MTINELKAIIKLNHGDRIVVLNDKEEIVEYDGSVMISKTQSSSN